MAPGRVEIVSKQTFECLDKSSDHMYLAQSIIGEGAICKFYDVLH
jgi:hypothetical protein